MQDIIWSAKEAERWQEAYLLGNGRMGAAVYGGVFEETVDLSEITFFSGSPSSENNQKGAALAFQEMRSLLQEGKEEAAMERASDFIGIRENYGTYDCGCTDYSEILELMKHDKKNENREINFTLLAGVGEVKINQTATNEEIKESLDFLAY